MTSENLKLKEESTTLLSEEVPAKTLAAPTQMQQDSMESAPDCGTRCSGLSMHADQEQLSGKTLDEPDTKPKGESIVPLELLSGTLPHSGTFANGILSQLPQLEQSIKGNGCSSSLTENKNFLLPTPTASDATVGAILNEDTKIRYTSNGTLRKVSNQGVDGSLGLTRYMMLATPKAADGLHPGVRNCKSGQTQHLSCQVIGDDAPKGAKLNPDFVSRMMGFPDNWVFTDKTCTGIPKLLTHEDLNEWITRSTDCNEDSERKDKLKALGNAVVPQCSAIIWHKLTDKIMKKIGARQFANI